MTLLGGRLYVANTDAVVSFPYEVGQTRIASPGEKLVDLPAGPINHHWTKDIVANPDGTRLFVTTGSNSNVAEDGMEVEKNRAAVLEVRRASSGSLRPDCVIRMACRGTRTPTSCGWS